MTEFTGQEKAEASALQKAVREIEAMFAAGTALAGSTNSMLLAFMLDRAKNRIADLERKEEAAVKEEREKLANDLAIAIKVQHEAALTAQEREQYEGFLGKEYFTKADFSSLEEFYKSAWDRLTEDGKAEMSHRIWEGVRRKEYEFNELPDIVKEKEAQFLYNQLTVQNVVPELQRIPQRDRDDFIDAWRAGEKERAYKVLDRSSFADHVALKGVAEVESVSVAKAATKAAAIFEAGKVNPSVQAEPSNAVSEVEYNMGDLKLVDNAGAKITAPPVGAPTGGKGKGH